MSTQPPQHNRNSAIRASVLDVFVSLGAFDRNNPITQWMFEDDENFMRGDGTQAVSGGLDQLEELEEEREMNRGRRYGSPRYDVVMEDGIPASTTTFKQRFGMFRSKSKSRKRERTIASDSSDIDQIGLGTIPKTRSKSKTRRLFSSKSKPVESTAAPTFAQTSSFTPEPVNSHIDVTAKKSIRRVFGRKRKNGETFPQVEESEQHADQMEDWEYVAPLTPGAFMKASWDSSRQEDAADADDADAVREGTVVLPRTLSFAIPRSALDRHISSAKRRITRPRLSSLRIAEEGEQGAIGMSTSLPPSPFVLVAPESEDYVTRASTPYVLCSPTIDQNDVQFRGPIYPISVSKTIRRSVMLDGLNLGDSEHSGRLGLRRSMSLQDMSRTGFFGDTETDISAYSPSPDESSKVKRGREAPFPPRPILPLPLSLSLLGDAQHIRLSLDARASVIRQRYRKEIIRNSISEASVKVERMQ